MLKRKPSNNLSVTGAYTTTLGYNAGDSLTSGNAAQYNFRIRRVWENDHGRWAVRRRNYGNAHVGFK